MVFRSYKVWTNQPCHHTMAAPPLIQGCGLTFAGHRWSDREALAEGDPPGMSCHNSVCPTWSSIPPAAHNYWQPPQVWLDLHHELLMDAHHEPTKDRPATSMCHVSIQPPPMFIMPHQHLMPPYRHATCHLDSLYPSLVWPQCQWSPNWCPTPASFDTQDWCSTQPHGTPVLSSPTLSVDCKHHVHPCSLPLSSLLLVVVYIKYIHVPKTIPKTGRDWSRPVVNQFWSGVWTSQNQSCNCKRLQKTGLQWFSPVFCKFGENEDWSWSWS